MNQLENLRRIILLAPVALALALPATPARSDEPAEREAAAGGTAVPTVDHHVHILSPTLVDDWTRAGARFSRPVDFYASADALLRTEDAADAEPTHRLQRVVLVPMSHLYGMGEIREALELDEDREREQVARENDYVAQQAARDPGRAAALASAPILRPYALEELKRCRSVHGVRGIKLHCAASGFDPREASHVEKLREIMAWADEHRLVVLLHLDPQRSGIETSDVRQVIERSIAPFRNAVVVIAHLGGSGGYGAWVQSVMATFMEWLEAADGEEGEGGTTGRNVYFDLSAVVVDEQTVRPFAVSDEEIAALRRDLRRLGHTRVVFGSDHPVFDPFESARILIRRLELDEKEAEAILANRLPRLWG